MYNSVRLFIGLAKKHGKSRRLVSSQGYADSTIFDAFPTSVAESTALVFGGAMPREG
jgi:hypothetical protein